jgi:hypothetical protein
MILASLGVLLALGLLDLVVGMEVRHARAVTRPSKR